MYCLKCGAEINSEMIYCPNCGKRLEINSDKKKVDLKKIKKQEKNGENNSDYNYGVSAKKTQRNKTIEESKIKKDVDRLLSIGFEWWKRQSVFNKVITILMVICAFSGLIAWLSGKKLSLIIVVLQIVLIIISKLLERRIIKCNKNWVTYVTLFLAIALCIPFKMGFSYSYDNQSYDNQNIYYGITDNSKKSDNKLVLPDNPLVEMIPKLNFEYGSVNWQDDNELSITIKDVTKTDFENYKEKCVEMGFSNDIEQKEQEYQAFNNNKYEINLTYKDSEFDVLITGPYYDISLTVACKENLIFNKYNLNVLMDDDIIGNVKHGDKETFQVRVQSGTHTLRIEDSEDKSVYDERDLNVKNNNTYKYNVECEFEKIIAKKVKKKKMPINISDIDGMKYEQVKEIFKEAGFTNITTKEVKDLKSNDYNEQDKILGVTIGAKKDFSKSKYFFVDEKIVIEYHSLKDITMKVGADFYEGKNYKEVKKAFKQMGFLNISFDKEVLDDSKIKNGSVSWVRIDNKKFVENDKISLQKEVVIHYIKVRKHLNVRNCKELKSILTDRSKSDYDYENFAVKYGGRIIEFDGSIDYMQKHGDKKYRYDILMSAGDYNSEGQIGPTFEFNDVGTYDMRLDSDTVPGEIWVGRNVKIIAKVGEFDFNHGKFYLIPIAVDARD